MTGEIAQRKVGPSPIERRDRTHARMIQALEEHGRPFASVSEWARTARVAKGAALAALKHAQFQALLRAHISLPFVLGGRAIAERVVAAGLDDSFLDRKLVLETLGVFVPRQQRDTTSQVNVRVWDLPAELAKIRAEQAAQVQANVVEGEVRLLPEGDQD